MQLLACDTALLRPWALISYPAVWESGYTKISSALKIIAMLKKPLIIALFSNI